MAWEGLKTWLAGTMPTAADFIKYINNNLEYLLNRNGFRVTENTGTYTTTSATLTNISSTLNVNLTTYGGAVLIGFQGAVYTSANGQGPGQLALNLDGSQVAVAETINGFNNASLGNLPFVYLWTPAAGNHTIALQWKIASALTLTMDKTLIPMVFWGREI